MNHILGETFLRVVVQSVAACVPGGPLVQTAFKELVGPFCNGGWDWLKTLRAEDRQAAITALAQMTPEDAAKIIEAELGKVASLTVEKKQELALFLAGVPMLTRKAIGRSDDLERPDTLITQLPPNQWGLAKYLPMHTPRFKSGDTIPHHDYQLVRLLGQGGFGEVWLARNTQRRMDKQLALKFCLDPLLTSTMVRELRVLEALDDGETHENIVHLITTAIGTDPPFIVYEYVDGGDLSAWLATFEGRPAPALNVYRVLLMAARGLAFAHNRGVVHLDLKPQNLLITQQGCLKIADFGIGRISKATQRASFTRVMTQTYITPEATTPMYADMDETTDPEKDIYALGVVAYQLLIGDTAEPMTPNWENKLVAEKTPQPLIDIVGRCVDVPGGRFSDAQALLDALDAIDTNQISEAPSSRPASARSSDASQYPPHSAPTVINTSDAPQAPSKGTPLTAKQRILLAVGGRITKRVISLVSAFIGSAALGITGYFITDESDAVTPDITIQVDPPMAAPAPPPLPSTLRYGRGISRVSSSGYTKGPAEDPHRYIPGRAMDGIPSTAWSIDIGTNKSKRAPSKPDWIATDVWLEIIFDTARPLSRIKLAAGFDYRSTTNNKDLFFANAHLKKLHLICENGSSKYERRVDVTKNQRTLVLSDLKMSCNRLLLKPVEVWLGESFNGFCISEIEIFKE